MKIKETLQSLLKLEPMAAGRGRNFARNSGLGLAAVALLMANAAWAQGQGWVGQCDYATPYTFITLAGSTTNAGWQNGTNQNAWFNWPQGVTVGSNGIVYVVDSNNNDVRAATQMGTNWAVTTIAGTDGNQFGTADGTNGTIQFDSPEAIAIDGGGNLYVADTQNNSIRKLTQVGTNWVSSTLATGFNNPYGLAVDSATNVYVADTINNVIDKLSLVGSNWVVTTIAGTPSIGGGASDGTNGGAQFYEPAGLAVDGAGNLFVGDSGNYAVRKITPKGTNWVVTTIAGTLGYDVGSGTGVNDGTNGAATFYSPLVYGSMALAVDANDNLFEADSGSGLIRKISPVGTNWVTTTVAGSITAAADQDGTGTNAIFGTPEGIALGSAGQLFVTDGGEFDLREGTLAVAPAAPPKLAFSRKTLAGSLTISWPGTGYTLQTNASLTTNRWGAYGGTINSSNGTNSVTVTAPTGKVFFRLSE